MFCLEQNKQTIYYANYTGKTEVLDTNGKRTGEYTLAYGTPTAIKVSVSARTGNATIDAFGQDVDYSVQIISDKGYSIAEGTKLWIGAETTAAATHIVSKVSKSLNHYLFAAKELK